MGSKRIIGKFFRRGVVTIDYPASSYDLNSVYGQYERERYRAMGSGRYGRCFGALRPPAV